MQDRRGVGHHGGPPGWVASDHVRARPRMRGQGRAIVSGSSGVVQVQTSRRRTRHIPATPAPRPPADRARRFPSFHFRNVHAFLSPPDLHRGHFTGRAALRREAWCAPCISVCAVSAIAGAVEGRPSLQWVGRIEDGDKRMRTDRIATCRVAKMNRRPAREFVSPLIAVT